MDSVAEETGAGEVLRMSEAFCEPQNDIFDTSLELEVTEEVHHLVPPSNSPTSERVKTTVHFDEVVQRGITDDKNFLLFKERLDDVKDTRQVLSDPPKRSKRKGFQRWARFVSHPENRQLVAPVSIFDKVPLKEVWDDLVEFNVGRQFEMLYKKSQDDETEESYTVVTVLEFVGYLTLVEDKHMREGDNEGQFYWVNFFDHMPKPIGYYSAIGIPEHKSRGHDEGLLMSDSIFHQKYNAKSIDKDHNEFVRYYKKMKPEYELNTFVEVIDHLNPNQMRLAKVSDRIGSRVQLLYVTQLPGESEFRWLSEHSSQIHPLGWSKAVGHDILETNDVRTIAASSFDIREFSEVLKLQEGDFLEAVHPLHQEVICGAQVTSVMKFGYVMVKFDVLVEDPTFFCFHASSPMIFPCGFCKEHGLKLRQPYEYAHLQSRLYLALSRNRAAPLHLNQPLPPNPFKPGMKLEAADFVDSEFIYPATVLRTAGHMIFLRLVEDEGSCVHGWFPQNSPDIFPAGYCGLVGHGFQCYPEELNPDILGLTTKNPNDTII